MLTAIGGFADLWLYGDPDYFSRRRPRDLRASVVASSACTTCGAQPGEFCSRRTATGRTVERRLPHFGRGVDEGLVRYRRRKVKPQ